MEVTQKLSKKKTILESHQTLKTQDVYYEINLL